MKRRDARWQGGQGHGMSAPIDAENRAFCMKLRLASQSDAYGQCTSGLDEVRRRHEERLLARAAGIL